VFDGGSETVRPTPDWIVSRRDAKLQIARG